MKINHLIASGLMSMWMLGSCQAPLTSPSLVVPATAPISPTATPHPSPVPDWLMKGKQAYEQKILEESLRCFNERLKQTPHDPETLACRADVYGALNQWENQIADLKHLIQLRRNNPEIVLQLGIAYARLQQPDQALHHANLALSWNPNYVEAYELRARIYFASKQSVKGVSDCLAILRLMPNHISARAILANYYESCSDYHLMLKYLDENTVRTAQLPSLWLNRSFAFARLKRFDESSRCIEQARILGAQPVDLYLSEVSLLIEKREFSQAEHVLSLVRALEPGNSRIVGLQGVVFARSGRDAQAVEAYTQCLTIDPNLRDYWNRANALARLNRMAEAEADFAAALAIDPHNVGVYCDRGTARIQHGQPEQALEDYNHAIKIAPDHASGYILRSTYWVGQKDWNQAVMDITKALELAPNESDYWKRRGTIYEIDLKNHDAALNDFNRSMTLQPQSNVACHRGYIYGFVKNDWNRAVAEYQYAIRLDPKNIEAYSGLVRLYEKTEKFDAALEIVRKALQISPNNLEIIGLRGRIKFQQGDMDAAMADANTVFRQNPGSVESWRLRPFIYASQKKYDLALADLNEALPFHPNSGELLNDRAVVHEKMKRYDESFSDYTLAQKIDGSLSSPYLGRAFIWLQKKEFDSAIEELTRLIEIQPTFSDAYRRRAIYKALAGRYEEALKDAQKAKAMGNPLDPSVIQEIEACLAKTK